MSAVGIILHNRTIKEWIPLAGRRVNKEVSNKSEIIS